MTATKVWLRITDCRSIPLREGRSVKVGGHEVAIFNLGDRFLAVENRCPHRGGPLADGIVSGTTVVCPLHAWRVNLAAGTVEGSGGAVSCVEKFEVRVQDGCILLAIPASAQMHDEVVAAEDREKTAASWFPEDALDLCDSAVGNAEI